jgi:hypothetical protein
MKLSEQHKDVIRMMIVAPDSGIGKRLIANFMGLIHLQTIEDLIELGLVYEFDNGEITLVSIIKSVVKAELSPDVENCRPLIDSLYAMSTNESIDIDGNKRSFVSLRYFVTLSKAFFCSPSN